MPRLFAALEIPPVVGESLALKKGKLRGARWIDPENYHITLSFLGDIDEEKAREASFELGRIKHSGFRIRIDHMDIFGSSKPRALFAGVMPDPGLMHFQAKLENALNRIGIETEKRKYTPHVTLARLSRVKTDELANYMMFNGAIAPMEFDVEEFKLYSSRSSRGGGPYLVEQSYFLDNNWKETGQNYEEYGWRDSA